MEQVPLPPSLAAPASTFPKLKIVEPPFGLRLLLPFWCRRGGYWCTAGARKRKIGARVGQGKIGAGVGSCQSMDPVGI